MKTLRLLAAVLLLPILAFSQSAPSVGAGAQSGSLNPAPSSGSGGTAITSIRMGTTAALVGGTSTVSDPGATANSRYFFTTHTLGTVTVPSAYYASARSVGVSFTIVSNQATDTSTVDWIAFN